MCQLFELCFVFRFFFWMLQFTSTVCTTQFVQHSLHNSLLFSSFQVSDSNSVPWLEDERLPISFYIQILNIIKYIPFNWKQSALRIYELLFSIYFLAVLYILVGAFVLKAASGTCVSGCVASLMLAAEAMLVFRLHAAADGQRVCLSGQWRCWTSDCQNSLDRLKETFVTLWPASDWTNHTDTERYPAAKARWAGSLASIWASTAEWICLTTYRNPHRTPVSRDEVTLRQ